VSILLLIPENLLATPACLFGHRRSDSSDPEIASAKHARSRPIIVSYRRAWNAIKPDRLNPPAHAERRILVPCFLTDASRDFPCVTPNAKCPGLESSCRDGRIPFTLQLQPGQMCSPRIFRVLLHARGDRLFFRAISRRSLAFRSTRGVAV